MHSSFDIEGAVRQFILHEILGGKAAGELTDTTELVERGVVDSINVLGLVDFIEESYDIMLEPNEVQQFTSIVNIARVVRAKRAA